jgi:hypothetical protein
VIDSFCRASNIWFLVLLFQRKGQFRRILPLLLLKPPRLMTARTETMPKFPEKKAAPLRCLPLLFLKSQAWIRRGSVSMNCFLQVPLLKEMRQGSPLLPILLKSKFLML